MKWNQKGQNTCQIRLLRDQELQDLNSLRHKYEKKQQLFSIGADPPPPPPHRRDNLWDKRKSIFEHIPIDSESLFEELYSIGHVPKT